MTRRLVCLSALLLAGGCGTMQIDEFAGNTPRFVLEDYFAGSTRATGLFEDRFGRVQRQFVVDIDGVWDGRTLTLTEDFVYDDGETEQRIWIIEKTAEARYSGTTANAVGAAEGQTSGNALHWQYDFKLAVGDDTWQVHFDDWMFLQPNGTLLNKATITRWGFKLGTVFLSFERAGP